MTMVLFQAAAEADVRGAYVWHEQQRPGLGEEFGAELRATLDRIQEHPDSFQVCIGTRGVHRCDGFHIRSFTVSIPSQSLSWRACTVGEVLSAGEDALRADKCIALQ